jgi:hypothetical protein
VSRKLRDLYKTWELQQARAVQRGQDKDEIWLSCPDDGTQVHLWEYKDERGRVFNVIPPGKDAVEVRGWVKRNKRGILVNGEHTDSPIPAYAINAMQRGVPCPPLDSFCGLYQKGELIAIIGTYLDPEQGEQLHSYDLVREDADRPAIWGHEKDGGRHLDMNKWWAYADKGVIKVLNPLLRSAKYEVITGKSMGTRFDYMVLRDKELTGVEGQVMFKYPGTRITLGDFIAKRRSLLQRGTAQSSKRYF